jgi:predicted secreted protein
MAKISAFGAALAVGTRQVEQATIVGTITGSGNARCITTATGMTGSPITTDFAVLITDTPDTVATKMRTALTAVANITAMFLVGGSGALVTLTRLIPAASIANLNMAVSNQTCTGLTDDATSDEIVAAVDYVTVAYLTNISGPGLALDTVDVTTHDSAGGWEEVVWSILRSGEVSLDLVYDPNAASQSFSTDGLGDRLEIKKYSYAKITFPGSYVWSFPCYIISYEPGAPVDGALTSTVKLKIDGIPVLV